MEKKILGILGGVGPLATMMIGEMIVRLTKAQKDQEHIHTIITNNTSIPDRTAYILGKSEENAVPVMVGDTKRLAAAGADLIIIPCNTAHTFYEELSDGSPIPILHMIHETAARAAKDGAKKIGILATSGTIQSEVYQDACRAHGLEIVLPDADVQDKVMAVIYEQIKAGEPADRATWDDIEQFMDAHGCDRVILGCTELSIVKRELGLGDLYLDSLTVLAEQAILACGYEVKGQ